MTDITAARTGSDAFVVHYNDGPAALSRLVPAAILFGGLFWLAMVPRTNVIFVDSLRDQRGLAAGFFGLCLAAGLMTILATALRIGSGRPALVITPDGVLGFNDLFEREFGWDEVGAVLVWRDQLRILRRPRTPIGRVWAGMKGKGRGIAAFDCILVPIRAVDHGEREILAVIRAHVPNVPVEY